MGLCGVVMFPRSYQSHCSTVLSLLGPLEALDLNETSSVWTDLRLFHTTIEVLRLVGVSQTPFQLAVTITTMANRHKNQEE